MKISNLFLSSLIILSIIFYACKNERKKVIKDGNINIQVDKYKNNKYGFSIEYPTEWQILKENQDVVFAVKMITDSLDNSFQNAIHITNLIDSNNTQVNLSDIVQASVNDMSNTFEKFKVVTNEKVNINELPAIKLKCSFVSNKESITTLLYFIKTSNNVYLVGLSSASGKFTEYNKVYEYIAKSFNVL